MDESSMENQNPDDNQMTASQLKSRIRSCQEEIRAIEHGTAEDVCLKYNVDFKYEIIALINEEITEPTYDFETASDYEAAHEETWLRWDEADRRYDLMRERELFDEN